MYTERLEEFAINVKQNTDFSNMVKVELESTVDDVVKQMTHLSNDLPKSRYRPNVRPFWNEKLKTLKAIKVRNFRIWVAEGRPRTADSVAWANHKNSKKVFRKEIKFVQREYERKELETLLKTAECDKN